MDVENIWQENKSFIQALGGGLLLFLIGTMVIDKVQGGGNRAMTRKLKDAREVLKKPLYDKTARTAAREQNELLTERVDALRAAVAFQPREEFQLRPGDKARNVYLSAVERVRLDLRDLASQRRATLPDGLGIERLENGRNEDLFERHLHALDLLDRVVRIALDAGVVRVKECSITLDRGFESGRGVGPVERTAVDVEVVSDPESVATWLARVETPDPAAGELRAMALPIESAELERRSATDSSVRARVRFLAVRLHDTDPGTDEPSER